MFLKTVLRKIRISRMNNNNYIAYLRKQGVVIGSGCIIDKSAIFGSEPWLICIGNNVRISKGVKFITHDGGIWTLRKMGLVDAEQVFYDNIVVGENCNIGWDAIIMPGVKIGKNCIIGAGAIITKDMPDNSVVAGVPARVIKSIEDYAEKKIGKCVPTFSMSTVDKKRYLEQHCPQLFNFDISKGKQEK